MDTSPDQQRELKRGLLQALGAHMFWGAMPLYLILVQSVPDVEFVAWRILFSLPLCLLMLRFTSGVGEVRVAIRDGATMLRLLASAVLIAVNWVVYVWAIHEGHVLAASLGYYITPFVMMLLGLVLLRERLGTVQWLAVALAALGVGVLAVGAPTTLWVSIVLAFSFATYGFVRKTVKAGALAGLTLETLLLVPAALATVLYYAFQPAGSALLQGWDVALAVAFGGAMTAIPLFLFASGARRLPYTLTGFVQFTAPTIVFILGLTVFGEELDPARLLAFVAIWCAVGLFIVSILRGRRSAKATPQRA
ncbi:EamA family transporter RarD [Paraurantiacibacter namhicola]|uniref:EamA-like transporter family protein n=1 Tax=Paraurantiacibacter namhicola TaxID=645517 RepID=A0A1C7DA50_9SPHN|nr:EamA family transporter RarD [Paraurantiacibacter namhicola]ANU08360.1 EamA-like transporter family protein [Paraurantiacibacter namhicola]